MGLLQHPACRPGRGLRTPCGLPLSATTTYSLVVSATTTYILVVSALQPFSRHISFYKRERRKSPPVWGNLVYSKYVLPIVFILYYLPQQSQQILLIYTLYEKEKGFNERHGLNTEQKCNVSLLSSLLFYKFCDINLQINCVHPPILYSFIHSANVQFFAKCIMEKQVDV